MIRNRASRSGDPPRGAVAAGPFCRAAKLRSSRQMLVVDRPGLRTLPGQFRVGRKHRVGEEKTHHDQHARAQRCQGVHQHPVLVVVVNFRILVNGQIRHWRADRIELRRRWPARGSPARCPAPRSKNDDAVIIFVRDMAARFHDGLPRIASPAALSGRFDIYSAAIAWIGSCASPRRDRPQPFIQSCSRAR
jgi:hypothetical protein